MSRRFLSYRFLHLATLLVVAAGISSGPRASEQDTATVQRHRAQAATGDALVGEYFRLQTQKLSEESLAEIATLADWQQRREEYRRQLREMLGLDPLPERTDLKAEVTSQVEGHGIVVENLHFQALPGLYVTGNLYRPAESTERLPTILYVCGHARVVKDGVSLGNKTAYQHHGAWFARNGYVCLTIDTIQLGEIEGQHHGTYRYGKWWWNNRGYTPAGVEAWNCIRALDYLESRPEVDASRIGITGRSGGGVYSWWTAALDDRIAAAVPVAGITTLHNHVVDGCVEGHCDCMYMVNTYRWDFDKVAALVAPRPLLISNSDKDRIFPLEGVVDIHASVRRIYQLHDAGANLGLQITEGPHKDTQELHLHAFRWFNRFLRDSDEMIEMAAVKLFDPEQLQVFSSIPADERVTTIDESFVPAASADELPESRTELVDLSPLWRRQLDEKTFRGWPTPAEQEPLDVHQCDEVVVDGLRVRKFEYASQSPYRLPIYLVQAAPADRAPSDRRDRSPVAIDVFVLRAEDWENFGAAITAVMPPPSDDEQTHGDESLNAAVQGNGDAWQDMKHRLEAHPDRALAYVAPRGVGPTQWTSEERSQTHVRRRFMLLGQTADGMRIWDIRRALQSLQQVDGLKDTAFTLHGNGDAAATALYTALYEDVIDSLVLTDPPTRNRDGLSLLNVSRFLEMPQLVLMIAGRGCTVAIHCSAEEQQVWQRLADWEPVGKHAAERHNITVTTRGE